MGSGVEVEIGIQQSLGGVGWGYRVAWVGVLWSVEGTWAGEVGWVVGCRYGQDSRWVGLSVGVGGCAKEFG